MHGRGGDDRATHEVVMGMVGYEHFAEVECGSHVRPKGRDFEIATETYPATDVSGTKTGGFEGGATHYPVAERIVAEEVLPEMREHVGPVHWAVVKRWRG